MNKYFLKKKVINILKINIHFINILFTFASSIKIMKKEILERYTDKIVELFRVSKKDFFSKTKKKELVDARQLLYFIAKDRQINVVYIQDYMIENGHDICHSTIIHGINNVRDKVESDEDYNKIINNINRQVSI